MSKRKGTYAERELIHMFFDSGWACLRAAGSGSIPLPVPDLIAGKNNKNYAIECKSLRSLSHHFDAKEIEDLELFSKIFGSIALIGMRFDRKGWFFVETKYLNKTKSGNYSLNFEFCVKNGKRFEEII
ncbi:Holliday junction resolvase [Candidatus Woesearchaeota archaeon]|nr:Holliday junction resolvase [Candidatus Woesearchaeota archaeon]